MVLKNIGIFAGTHTLNLDNTDKKPIILIGGLNGRGKTTILESILFALYGKRVCNLLDGNWKYEEYLERLGNYQSAEEQNYVELTFCIDREEKREEYIIRREWNKRNKKVNVIANRDGYVDKVLSTNWDMFIEEIIPLAIAPFFFFDGEKISELVASENDGQLIESMKNLLGISIIQQALIDIDTMIKNKQKEIKSTEYQDSAQQYLEEIESLNSKIGTLNLKSIEIGQTILQERMKCNELEEQFVISGGGLLGQREDLIAKKTQIEEEIADKYEILRVKAAENLPLLLVKPLLDNIFEAVKEEERNNNKYIIIKELPSLYDEFSKGKERKESIEAFLKYLESSSMREPIYNMSGEGLTQLMGAMNNFQLDKGQVRKELSEIMRKRKELEDIENQLSVHIDQESVANIYSEIKGVTAYIAVLEEQTRNITEQKEMMLGTLERVKNEYQKILDKAAFEMDTMDDLRRIIEYALKEKKVLEEYKNRIQKLKTAELADMISHCFKQIATKNGLLGKIVIDEENLKFRYYSNDKEVSKNNLSAGEKQLLVTAILWGLGICSKKELPIIIDTPLGRLDSLHRQALIKNYFPKASKQMIILSTDQEITQQDYDNLKPYVEREYILLFDERTNSSSVREGYFGGK